MNQFSLLSKGMAIIVIAVFMASASILHLNLDYVDPKWAVNYYPYQAFMAVVVLGLWYALLKKDIPLNLSINFNKTFFVTLPIFLIPVSILIFTLLTSKTLDYEIIAMLFATALFVGITEEMIFRVAGYRVFKATGSSVKKAIFLSALLFSLFHLTNLFAGVGSAIVFQLINTFMLGVVLAYIYYKTESILYVMILHFMWDFSSFVLTSFGDTKSLMAVLPFVLSVAYFIWAFMNILKLKKS